VLTEIWKSERIKTTKLKKGIKSIIDEDYAEKNQA